jgi:hypothetical protein
MTLRHLAPVALVVLAAALAGCSSDDTPADPGPAPDDVVVQAMLRPAGKDPQAVPDYTLYGDGRLYSVAPGGAAFPTLRLHQVNPATAQALRRSALNVVAGGSMADSGPQLDASPQAAVTVQVRLGNTEESMPRRTADALLVDLAKASGGAKFRAYAPARVAVIATETRAAGATRPWTVSALTNGKPFRRPDTICTVLAAAQIPLAQQSAAGTTLATVWTSAGRAYRLTFRPLLPTESDCGSL